MGQGVQTGGKMITELEKKIRDLQKELAEIKKDQSVLRLQPCRGDSEIMAKDGKLEELDMRAKTINRNHPRPDKKTPAVDFRIHYKMTILVILESGYRIFP